MLLDLMSDCRIVAKNPLSLWIRASRTTVIVIGYSFLWVWQVMSGGLLQATPHCVKAPRREVSGGVSRNTLAVFMQPR